MPSLGHRTQLLATDSFFAMDREIGVGFVSNASSTYGNYWAIHTAYVNTTNVFLTGVVYNDANSDGLYSLGEGLAGVSISIGSASTVTNAAGGWSIQVQPGRTYTVTVQGRSFAGIASTRLTMGKSNVELDFISGQSRGIVNFVNPAPPVHLPPVLTAPVNQSLTRSENQLTVNLSASDPGNYPLTYSAQAMTLGYWLKQQLGLTYTGDYYLNSLGHGEKWLLGAGKTWYAITPTGQLFRSAGWSLVADLDPSYYVNPSLLFNAQPTVPVALTVTGSQLTINRTPGFANTFVVYVTVSDGSVTNSKPFIVMTRDQAPVLASLPNQAVAHTQDNLVLNLSASDADRDPVSYTVQVVNPAYSWQRQLGLYFSGSYYTNSRGLNEKWLQGTGGSWYAIMPNGQLVNSNWNVLTTLDPSYYADPSLLFKAAETLPIAATITGNQLTLNPGPGFCGEFSVYVTASDGVAGNTQCFTVTITDQAPVLGPLANRTMAAGLKSLVFNLAATDADNDQLSYSAQVVSPLYDVRQQLGLYFDGSYHYNQWGLHEKWLRSGRLRGTVFFRTVGCCARAIGQFWPPSIPTCTLIPVSCTTLSRPFLFLPLYPASSCRLMLQPVSRDKSLSTLPSVTASFPTRSLSVCLFHDSTRSMPGQQIGGATSGLWDNRNLSIAIGQVPSLHYKYTGEQAHACFCHRRDGLDRHATDPAIA